MQYVFYRANIVCRVSDIFKKYQYFFTEETDEYSRACWR